MNDEMEARWEALKAPQQESGGANVQHLASARSGAYRPLSEAADEFARWASRPQERVYLGIDALDEEMRGIAPGEMCLLIGHSHGGKTLTLLQILRATRNRRVVVFTPDEPRPLVLIKLAAVTHGVRAREIEDRIASGDQSATDLLKATATEDFPTLAVFDQTIGIGDMERCIGEVTDLWGASPELVVFDYLQLLGGDGDAPSQASALKAWGRRHNVPLLVIHQTSRSSGADGKRLTMNSGAYGGEQQATHIIGVRRKVFEIEAELAEIESKLDKAGSGGSERLLEQQEYLRHMERIHKHTITVSLLKNKRPDASRLPEIDFEIEKGTGRLWKLDDGVLPEQYLQEVRGA